MGTLSIQGIYKRFGAVAAVNGISLTVQPGELVTLLGPSGCGKTTLLRLIAGFLEPDAGEIRVGDRLLSSSHHTVPAEHRGLSMIFQSYAVWPHMTVFDNVAYGLRLRRLSRSEVSQRTRQALQMVRLDHLAERYPGQLSGGQQQRVALARALVVEPAVLLLDEPLSNLDANLRAEMRNEIRRLHAQFPFAAVYVTHDQDEAMAISDRIAVVNQGMVEQVGTPDEVYQHPASKFVATFVGKANCLVGQVQATSPGYMTVQVDGLPLKVAAETPGPFAIGSPVEVCIRPHAIRLSTTPAEGAMFNSFAARVEEELYMGQRREYTLVPEGTSSRLLAEVQPEQRFPVGTRVIVSLDPAQITVVPPESSPQ